MSPVESVSARADHAAHPPQRGKRPKLESTSFDLALAQALSGKREGSAPAPPPPASSGPRSGGSEQAAAAPKRMTGADAPCCVETKPVARGEEPDGKDPQARSDPSAEAAEATAAPETEPARAPEARLESAPASPQIEASRVDSKVAARAVAAGTSRSTGMSEGSIAAPAAIRAGGDSGVRRATGTAEAANASDQPAAAHDSMETPETPSDRSAGHVTVRFSGENGRTGRIRLAVRGQAVHATIVSSDHDAVRRWKDDLSSFAPFALTQGFSEARVTVRESQSSEPAAASRRDPGDQLRKMDPRSIGGHPRRRSP